MLRRLLAGQFAHPRGPAGRWAMRQMNERNDATNRRVVESLGIAPGERVLDVGFGGGAGLAALLASPAGTVAGVDVSRTAVAAAGRRFADAVAAGRLELRAGSADALPFGDGSFARALSVHTAYFWKDPARCAAELARVVAPGGRCVVAVAAKAFMQARGRDAAGFRLYEPEELETLLVDGGFAAVRIDASGPVLAVADR